MEEIFDCYCPNCKKEIADYYEYDNDYCYDGDCFYNEFHIHCNCGTRFKYIEYFTLAKTEIEV